MFSEVVSVFAKLKENGLLLQTDANLLNQKFKVHGRLACKVTSTSGVSRHANETAAGRRNRARQEVSEWLQR